MKCKKIKKWLSDNIDGELSERKRKKVEEHIQKCLLCRSYRSNLEKIHRVAKNLDYGKVTPDYWENFVSKIKGRISTLEQKERKSGTFALGWRWAWIGAGLSLVVLLGLFLFQFKAKTDQEIYVFSFEDSFEQIYQEIGDNSELEGIFNLMIVESIGESLEEPRSKIGPDIYDLSSFLEEFTDEELIFLDSEIKKEIKS